MVSLLLLIFLSGFGGSPPPNEQALALFALGLWLFVPWGYWVDRHREVTGGARRSRHRDFARPGRTAAIR